MKAVLQSLAASLFATCLASFFLLMMIVGTLGALARLRTGHDYPEIDPSLALRQIGLPLAAVMFMVFFFLSLHRFRRPQKH